MEVAESRCQVRKPTIYEKWLTVPVGAFTINNMPDPETSRILRRGARQAAAWGADQEEIMNLLEGAEMADRVTVAVLDALTAARFQAARA